ncbi:50S ribosomal protein L21 [Candidatus Vidania fulgoroideae]|nr:50S ribosomal protein L21 [Candidatus Vidania fulgoroideae]
MIIVFEYKGIQYLINDKEYIKVKNINFVGRILINKVILIYNDDVEIGRPFIKKTLEIESELYKKEKKISLKFKKRKRLLKRKGFKNYIFKIKFIGIK